MSLFPQDPFPEMAPTSTLHSLVTFYMIFANCLNSLLREGIVKISKHFKMLVHIKITTLESMLFDWMHRSRGLYGKIFSPPLLNALQLYKDAYISQLVRVMDPSLKDRTCSKQIKRVGGLRGCGINKIHIFDNGSYQAQWKESYWLF